MCIVCNSFGENWDRWNLWVNVAFFQLFKHGIAITDLYFNGKTIILNEILDLSAKELVTCIGIETTT